MNKKTLPVLIAAILNFPLSVVYAAETPVHGLIAEYFPNTTLMGDPIRTEVVPGVNFDWKSNGPIGIPNDFFSARWSGFIDIPSAGPWTFTARSDDGFALWINGRLVISSWSDHSLMDSAGTIMIPAGRAELVAEYYERMGSATAVLYWKGGTAAQNTLIPTDNLFPIKPGSYPNKSGNEQGWLAEYFSGTSLENSQGYQIDPYIDFSWSHEAPKLVKSTTDFSIRWMGIVEPTSDGTWFITTRTNDGTRLWVDQKMLIDNWRNQAATENTASLVMKRGEKYSVRMDYFQGPGESEAQLRWHGDNEPERLIPASRVTPADVLVTMPTHSLVSPVFIEGFTTSNAVLNATSNLSPITIGSIASGEFYVNAPLYPSVATPVSIRGDKNSAHSLISWEPIQIKGDTSITVRKGDSLLFEPYVSGSWKIISACGVEHPESEFLLGISQVNTFNEAGIYSVEASSDDNRIVGRVQVFVADVRFPDEIACQVNYTRTLSTGVHPSSADISFFSNDESLLIVKSPKSDSLSQEANRTLYITPLRRGSPRIVARIGGDHGPIVCNKCIDEFTVDLPHRGIVINSRSRVGYFDVIMRPYIPKLEVVFGMFASRSTLCGGSKSITVSTDSFMKKNVADEIVGVFPLELQIPTGESKACVRAKTMQSSPIRDFSSLKSTEISPTIVSDSSANPNLCNEISFDGEITDALARESTSSLPSTPRPWRRIDRVLEGWPEPTIVWRGDPLIAPRGVNRLDNLLLVTDPGNRNDPTHFPARIVAFDILDEIPRTPPRIFFMRPGFLRSAKWSYPITKNGRKMLAIADQGVELPDGTFTGEGAKVFLLPVNPDNTAGEPIVLWEGLPFKTPTALIPIGDHLVVTDPGAGPFITRPERPAHPFPSSVIFSLSLEGGQRPVELQSGAPYTSLIGICPAIPGWLIINDTDSGRIDPSETGGRPNQFAPPAAADRWLIKIEDSVKPILSRPIRTPFHEEGPVAISFSNPLEKTAVFSVRIGRNGYIYDRGSQPTTGFKMGKSTSLSSTIQGPTSSMDFTGADLGGETTITLNTGSDVMDDTLDITVDEGDCGYAKEMLPKDPSQPPQFVDNKHGGATRAAITAIASTTIGEVAPSPMLHPIFNQFTADNAPGHAAVWIYPQGGGTPVAIAQGAPLVRTLGGILNAGGTEMWITDQAIGALFSLPFPSDDLFNEIFPERSKTGEPQ